MALVNVSVEVDTAILDALVEAAREAPRTVRVVVTRQILPALERRLLPRLRETPGPPRYPLAWQTERQRRAYFATDGFGAGIPYRRTGSLAGAWAVEARIGDQEGVIEVTNTSEIAQYVYGPSQQRFHAQTGWPTLADIDDMILEEAIWMEDALTEAWFDITTQPKGVRLA